MSSTTENIDNTLLNHTKSTILTPEGTPEPELGPPSVSTKQVQVIDGDQSFNNDLQTYFNDEWKISNAGFDYNVVAVFGSQSTGKSTLLNNLFGTTFATMSDARRQQTTKGLWMSMAQNSHTLIMDVEGTDGRERGEDQDFERKSALFSLAISQVLIVNLWESQVGLYNGANMGLLKTVFEVNLELFQQKGKSKTLLFFVIRDHLGNVPLNELSQTVKEDLEKIWTELSKPSGLEKCSITDFFDFMFFGLPHKILMPKDFDEQSKVLAKCFYDKDHSNYVFRPQYHKMIPADGFTHFVESIWEQIITNKNLDLPTQQQLLAQFRCDEISSEIVKLLIEKFLPYKSSIESGKIIPDLGQVFLQNVDTALSRFDSDAGRYNKDVYKKKRLELISRIYDILSVYFIGQLRNIHRQNISSFPKRLDAALKEHKGKFNDAAEAAKKETVEAFKKGATEIILEGSEWTFVQELNQLDHELENLVINRREQELSKSNSEIEKGINVQLVDSIPELFQDPQVNLWSRVLKVFTEINESIEDLVDTQAKNFGFTDEETTLQLTDTRVKLWNLLIRKIKDELQDDLVLVKLRSRLEESFRYDQDGLPKVWKPEDDIDAHFKKARAESLKLIPLLSTIDTSSELDNFSDMFAESTEPLDFKRSLKIFSETKQKDFENKLKRESDALYLEAKRSIVSTTEKIPLWALAIMLALGWNEIYVVLTNPLYFIFLIVSAIIIFVAYRMNLLRPIITVVNVASQEGYRQLHDLLANHFHPNNTPTAPVEAIPMTDFGLKRTSTTASEMTLVDHEDTGKFGSEKSKLN